MLAKAVLSLTIVSLLTTCAPAQTDLAGIKCIVSGARNAVPSISVGYNGGRVFFSSDDFAAKFKRNVDQNNQSKYTVRANHQLVLTGQYVQTACPVTGLEVDKNLTCLVGGTRIGFNNRDVYRQFVATTNLESKAKLVFANRSFKQTFSRSSQHDKQNTIK